MLYLNLRAISRVESILAILDGSNALRLRLSEWMFSMDNLPASTHDLQQNFA